ncbi:MAG: phage head closure protein [Clostridium sp.]
MEARVNIKKKNKTIENGRPKEVLQDYYECWCTPKELYGKELYEAINTKLESVLTFEVRYCEKIKAMRKEAKKFIVIFDEQQFEVYHVDFKANARDKVIIKANAIT